MTICGVILNRIARLIPLALLLSALLLSGCVTTPVKRSYDEIYSEGERLYKKGDYSEAVSEWKKVREAFHTPELSTRAEIGIANAYFMNKAYIEAAAAYEDFRKLHPKHPEVSFALYRQGLCFFNQISGIDTDQTPVKNAESTFASYIKLYPEGSHIQEVKAKHRECRDKQLQYEIYVGRFYVRTDKFKAAISRLESADKIFAGFARRDELLFYLGRAYLGDGQKAKGLDTLKQMLTEFPKSALAADAKKLSDSKK